MFLVKTFLIMCFVFLAVYMWPVLGRINPGPERGGTIKQNINLQEILSSGQEKLPAEFLYIPKLNIRAPVIFETSGSDERIYKYLEEGVVHYAGSPKPGETGTSIILGHSSAYPWYEGDYGKIFSELSELSAGDDITVSSGGHVLNYKIKEMLVISSDNLVEADEFGTTKSSALILMTCWPTGTNSKRLAVKAELVN